MYSSDGILVYAHFPRLEHLIRCRFLSVANPPPRAAAAAAAGSSAVLHRRGKSEARLPAVYSVLFTAVAEIFKSAGALNCVWLLLLLLGGGESDGRVLHPSDRERAGAEVRRGRGAHGAGAVHDGEEQEGVHRVFRRDRRYR